MIIASRITALAGGIGALALVALLSVPAAAQVKLVDEVKIGGFAHDIGFLTHHVETGADVNLEMLFTPPDVLRIIGSPRPHIGADINTSGHTSDGYFGLTWGIMLIQSLFGADDGVFANGSLGGAVHDGFIDTAPAGRKRLGSRVLFREGLDVGYWIMEKTNISLYLDHISDAGLTTHNDGLTNLGVRVGFGL